MVLSFIFYSGVVSDSRGKHVWCSNPIYIIFVWQNNKGYARV